MTTRLRTRNAEGVTLNPSTRPPTPSMLKTLRAIVKEHEDGVIKERKLWGEKSATSLAAKGVCSANYPWRDVSGLIDRGLLRVVSVEHAEGERLRRGAYGKWIGGTKRTTSSSFMVLPTQ